MDGRPDESENFLESLDSFLYSLEGCKCLGSNFKLLISKISHGFPEFRTSRTCFFFITV